MEIKNSKNDWFKLDDKKNTWLHRYFVFIIITALIILICSFVFLSFPHTENIVPKQVVIITISLAASLLGAGLRYVRKLYKACINLDITVPENASEMRRQLGVFRYFLLRPLYSLAFALLFLFSFKAGFSLLVKYEGLKEEFIYFAGIVCFFLGYFSGDMIDSLDSKGKSFSDAMTTKLNSHG